jgi:hypothetical protein
LIGTKSIFLHSTLLLRFVPEKSRPEISALLAGSGPPPNEEEVEYGYEEKEEEKTGDRALELELELDNAAEAAEGRESRAAAVGRRVGARSCGTRGSMSRSGRATVLQSSR